MVIDYNTVFEIKHKKGKKFFIILLVIAIILLGVFTVYRVFFRDKIFQSDIYVQGRPFYAVTMAQSSSMADLQSKYDSAVAIGGSGYVWQGKDMHYLIALIYPREDMANSVIGSNNIPGFDLQVAEFNIPTIDYDLQDLDSTNIDVIQNALNKCIALADILYDLTIDCQLGEISTIACASSINNYKGELQGYTQSVSNILEHYPSSNISHLQEVLIKCTNILDTMVNDLLTNDMVGNIMKYSYCEYIYMLCNY